MVAYTSPLAIPYPTSTDALKDTLLVIVPALANQVDDLIAALSAVAATAWTDLSLASGWAHLGDVGYGVEHSQYARGANLVTLSIAQTKSSWSAGATVCTVPSGYRPSRPIRFVAGINGVGEFMTVHPDGTVTADASGTVGITGTVSYPL